MWTPESAGGPMRGKNGETKGRAAAIKIPTHVAMRIFPAPSCGATTTDGALKSAPASRLSVIESEPDLLIPVNLLLHQRRLSRVNSTRLVLGYRTPVATDR